MSYVGISISFGVGPFVLNPTEVADPPLPNADIYNNSHKDSVDLGNNSTNS